MALDVGQPGASSAPCGLAAFPPRRWHLWLAWGAIVLVYFAGVTDKWTVTPDSALYLGLGRSLAAGEGYRFNGQLNTDVAPGLPLMLAGLRSVFGEGYLAPNLFLAACGVGTLLAAHGALRRILDRRTAMAVVLACAFSYPFYLDARRILTDMPFALAFWVAVYAFVRSTGGSLGWALAGGLSAAVGLAVRAPGLAMLAPLAVMLPLNRFPGVRCRRLALLAGGLVLAVATVGAALYFLGRYAGGNDPAYAETIRRAFRLAPIQWLVRPGLCAAGMPDVVTLMLFGQEDMIAIGVIAILLMLAGGVALWRRGFAMPLGCVVLAVIFLGLVGEAQAARVRYLLPLQPLIVLMILEGLLLTASAVAARLRKPAPPRLCLTTAAIFVALVIAANAPKVARDAVYYKYLSYTPRYYDVVRHGQDAGRFRVAGHVQENCPPGRAVAASDRERSILHYLTGLRVMVVCFPGTGETADPAVVLDALAKAPEAALLVVDGKAGSALYRRLLDEALLADGHFPLAFERDGYRVYSRVKLP